MNETFTQPRGSVSKDVNKQSIARMLGLKQDQIAYISNKTLIDSYAVLFDEETQLCFWKGSAVGTPISWTITDNVCFLTTNMGSYNLISAMAGDWLSNALGELTGMKLIGGTGYVTPQMKGAKGDGTTVDTASILAAANEAIATGKLLLFPAGNYVGDTLTINLPINIHVMAGASLNFSLIIKGEYFDYSNSVSSSAPWSEIPAGTTILSGNFSSFNTTKPVVIKLNDVDGGSASQGNEIGVDFSSITSATSTSLTLSTPTRFAYQKPDIQNLKSAVKYSGALSADDFTIPGDYTAYFSAGDVIRIENTTGTNGVESKTAYFEVIKIKSIDSTSIIFEKGFEYTHENPWLVKTGYVKNVQITGTGYVKRLELLQLSDVIVKDIRADRVVSSFLYNLEMSGLRVKGLYEPSSMNTTYVFGHSIIDNIKISGSLSTTDNAGFKVMSSCNITISNITSRDSNATGSQGNYGYYMDAIFTPYYGANRNVQVSNIKVEPSRATVLRSVWFYGLRESVVNAVSGGQTFFQGCVDCMFSGVNIPKYNLEIKDLVRCEITCKCKSGLSLGGVDNIHNITCHGLGEIGSSSANIAFRVGSGVTNPETGVAQVIGSNNMYNIIGLSDSDDAITLQLQSQDYPIVGRCVDKPTVSKSVNLVSGVTNPSMVPGLLKGYISAGSGWLGAKQKGGINFSGDYRDGYVIINDYYVWMGRDGHLRASTVKPTSDNPSGVIIIGPSTKGAAVANSTGTDAASVAVNSLMESLRAAGLLSTT